MSRYLLASLILARCGTAMQRPSITRAPGPLVRAAIPTTIVDDDDDDIADGAEACVTLDNMVSACDTGDGLDGAELQSCLCCDGTTFEPAMFDGAAASCAGYISTALPESTSDYSLYSELGSFCSGAKWSQKSGVLQTANLCTRTPSSTATVTTTRLDDSCYSMADIVGACQSETTGFATLPLKTQAECYCYISDSYQMTWQPEYFDGFADECAEWASTGDPSNYKTYSTYAGLCEDLGDWLISGSATTTVDVSATGGVSAAQTGQGSPSVSSPTASATGTTDTSACSKSRPMSSLLQIGGGTLLTSLWFML